MVTECLRSAVENKVRARAPRAAPVGLQVAVEDGGAMCGRARPRTLRD